MATVPWAPDVIFVWGVYEDFCSDVVAKELDWSDFSGYSSNRAVGVISFVVRMFREYVSIAVERIEFAVRVLAAFLARFSFR